MTVTHFQRHARSYSIEREFAAVRGALPREVQCRVAECRYPSQGILRRAWNLLEAVFRQGDVNHITGDIHYLTYLLRKDRTILTVQDCGGMTRLKGWRRTFFHWFWLSIPVWRSSAVTAISDETKREIIKYTGCPEAKLRVVPVPVGPEFQASPKIFDSLRPLILQVGAGANKNVGRLAAAIEGLDCDLHIVGVLRDEDRVRLDASGISYRVSERLTDQAMVQAYRECDLVAFASTYEGFGMPIIEANATGRPIVTSALSPMCDVAGGAACLVDPGDVASIRGGILRVTHETDYRESLIQAGYLNAQRFSPASVAEKYVQIYHELIGSRR